MIQLHGMSLSWSRRRRDSEKYPRRRRGVAATPRNIHVVAAASPRLHGERARVCRSFFSRADANRKSREGPLPRRDWHADGYTRQSRARPGAERHRYRAEGWVAADERDAAWEWCGRAIRTAPPLPPKVVTGLDDAPEEEEEAEMNIAMQLQHAIIAADQRAQRAEAAAAARVDALADELRLTQRELAARNRAPTPSPRTAAEQFADDEVIEEFTKLKMENEVLREALAAARAPLPDEAPVVFAPDGAGV